MLTCADCSILICSVFAGINNFTSGMDFTLGESSLHAEENLGFFWYLPPNIDKTYTDIQNINNDSFSSLSLFTKTQDKLKV